MNDQPESALNSPSVGASGEQRPIIGEEMGPIVTFVDAAITVQTLTIPATHVVASQDDTDASMLANADVQPHSIARAADFVIINFGGGKLEKHLLRSLEVAMANGSLSATSALGKALLLAELVTYTALPPRAQRALHAFASHDCPLAFAKAQQSAVFAAFVEGFAPKGSLAGAKAFIAGIADATQRAALETAFDAFETALTHATTPDPTAPDSPAYGDYQHAYDVLLPLLALAAPHETPTRHIYPESATAPVQPSGLIAIANYQAPMAATSPDL